MKSGAHLPLDYIGMGKITNAPFASKMPLFFDGDSRSQNDVIFDDFPPGPESFFPNPVVYTPVDAFLPDSFLPDEFSLAWAIILAGIFSARSGFEPATLTGGRGLFTARLDCYGQNMKRPLCDPFSPVF